MQIWELVFFFPAYPGVPYAVAFREMAEPGGPPPEDFGVTVRTVFPETWIWDLAEVGWVVTYESVSVIYMGSSSSSLQPHSHCSNMWSLHRESGEAQVPLTVPDTITTWETEAFCLSPQGFGLAPPVQLTVFQPFFLELSLPYSIIRGETFELKATVFNYLPKCIMVLHWTIFQNKMDLATLKSDHLKLPG